MQTITLTSTVFSLFWLYDLNEIVDFNKYEHVDDGKCWLENAFKNFWIMNQPSYIV